jgi:hypothetical protein
MKKLNLLTFFDRVVLIGLRRRPDRLAQAAEALRRCDWPFRQPEYFPAVDGLLSPPPAYFKHGHSAWGCLCSHRRVLGRAIRDGINRLLILEDDVCFVDGFRNRVEKFLQAVPDDWDGLMLGGEHIHGYDRPTLVKPGIYRCACCQRTHCYAVRGKYLRKLYQRLRGGGKFKGNHHCDCIMGEDPELQPAHKVYAPAHFLAGQERSRSDNFAKIFPRQFWNPPPPGLSVINLHAPQPLAAALREHGWYTGMQLDLKNQRDIPLSKCFRQTKWNPPERVKRLREWIKSMQWLVGHDPDFVCTIWHPKATPKLIEAASLWPVCEVTAKTVKDALRQVPRKLRRPVLSVFT